MCQLHYRINLYEWLTFREGGSIHPLRYKMPDPIKFYNSIEGINMTEAVIKLALGEKIDITNYGNSGKSVAIKFMPASSGKIKSID